MVVIIRFLQLTDQPLFITAVNVLMRLFFAGSLALHCDRGEHQGIGGGKYNNSSNCAYTSCPKSSEFPVSEQHSDSGE